MTLSTLSSIDLTIIDFNGSCWLLAPCGEGPDVSRGKAGVTSYDKSSLLYENEAINEAIKLIPKPALFSSVKIEAISKACSLSLVGAAMIYREMQKSPV